jgi:ribokinase
MSILVVGSMNMDLVVKTNRYPQRGETVTGEGFKQIPGGKGANQAVSAAKLGGDVSFVSACGQDDYGDRLLNKLKKNGVNIDYVSRLKENTGIAIITVEEKNDNRIIIIPGSNGKITPGMVNKAENIIKDVDYIMLQLEIPLKTVIYTIEKAHEYNTKVILDPAPVQKLPKKIYTKIDYLLPNEIELDTLLSEYGSNKGIDYLLDLGVKNILLTEGEKGVTHYKRNYKKRYEGNSIQVVDTTAAGDAFAAGFAFGLDQGWSEDQAIKFANKVGAMTVSKFGAQTALPSISEVNNRFKAV